MELLTPRGWASAYTVEAIITQLAASLVKGQVGTSLSAFSYIFYLTSITTISLSFLKTASNTDFFYLLLVL